MKDNKHFLMALTGLFNKNPLEAISLFPTFPDTLEFGRRVSLKLDLVWDNLSIAEKQKILKAMMEVLPQCGSEFQLPLEVFCETKQFEIVK